MSKLINDTAHYDMIADLANTLLYRANLLTAGTLDTHASTQKDSLATGEGLTEVAVTKKGNGADARERAALVREALQLAARCPYPIITTGLLAVVVRLQSAARE